MMRRNRGCCWVLLFISVLAASCALGAADIPCDQVHAAAHIARADSLGALAEEKKTAGGYIVEIVSAFRAFELQPRSRVLAADLLGEIPSDETQQGLVLSLDSLMCDGEPVAEMEALARIQYHLPRMLARAVELAPEYMKAYVKYSLISVRDPHSDYAIQMQRVCRNRYQEFTKAVAALPEADRKWFMSDVFDPKRCRAIALPEAD